MQTYWHVTPASKVRKILLEGLRPQFFKGAALYEADKYALFLWEYKQEAISFLSDLLQEEDVPPNRIYALLRIKIPYRIPLQEDEFDLLYTTVRIPPQFIKVMHIESLVKWVGM